MQQDKDSSRNLHRLAMCLWSSHSFDAGKKLLPSILDMSFSQTLKGYNVQEFLVPTILHGSDKINFLSSSNDPYFTLGRGRGGEGRREK